MASILIIDDDETMRTALELMLIASGHAVTTADDGLIAAKLFRSKPFDLILTDIIMPNREGLETIITLHREFPKVGVIAVSGGTSNSEYYLDLAARLGAHRTLVKPVTPGQLATAIADTLAACAPPEHTGDASDHA